MPIEASPFHIAGVYIDGVVSAVGKEVDSLSGHGMVGVNEVVSVACVDIDGLACENIIHVDGDIFAGTDSRVDRKLLDNIPLGIVIEKESIKVDVVGSLSGLDVDVIVSD